MREWNVLATSLEGRRDALLTGLRSLGEFWRAGYRNVVVGRVADQRDFLEAVKARLASDMLLQTALTKVVPVELVVAFEPLRLAEVLLERLTPLADRLSGKKFYVRLERRGLKGVVHTPTVERAVGDALFVAAAARGPAPTVGFTDPDVIVAIETTGQSAGVGFLTRELRDEYPFVRVP
jgi:tRNA(Ser,Leu) C12 N-acetylase TAN1